MARAIVTEFINSVEEHVHEQYDLYAKIFKYVNGSDNVSFSSATVQFKAMDSRDYCINFKALLKPGIECLQLYSQHGFDNAIIPDAFKESLKCLVAFLEQKDIHLTCLVPFMDGNDTDNKIPNVKKEPIYTFLLAEHVFSQLIPGQGYFLDRHHFPKDLVTCPGKCSSRLEPHLDKPTGIGNGKVWHGYADIWLESNIPVSVVSDETEDSAATVQMPARKRKLQTDDVVIEVKQPFCKLIENDTVSQTVAQTIVNSFIQSTTGFVPTLCTTYGYLMIFMYDCKNDIFLMSSPKSPLKLFRDEDFIDIHIIYLWMILNYEVCFSKPSEIFLRFCKDNQLQSKFPEKVEDKIEIYKQKLCKNVNSFTNVKENWWPGVAPHRIPF